MLDKQIEGFQPGVAEQLADNWQRLSTLFTEVLPVFKGQAPPFSWAPTAMGLLARGHYAQQSLFAIKDRRLDAAVLARVAFEHLVTFAWIMIDPATHHPKFLRSEHTHTKALLKDLDAQNGSVVVEGGAEVLAEIEVQAAKDGMPKFGPRAAEADEYWTRAIPTLQPWQFRLLYSSLYRTYSAYVHPLMTGIWPFVHEVGDGEGVRIGGPPQDLVPGHLEAHSAQLLASTLAICWSKFGYPHFEAIRSAWTHNVMVTNGVVTLAEKPA